MRFLPLLVLLSLITGGSAIAQTPSTSPKIQADTKLKSLRNRLDQPPFALKPQLQEIQAMYRAIGDQEGLEAVQIELAAIAYNDGEYAEADRLLQGMTSLSRVPLIQGKQLALAGFLHLEAGDYQSAYSKLTRAQAYVNTDIQLLNRSRIGIGIAHHYMGDYYKAIVQLTVSARSAPSQLDRAEASANLGNVYFDLGRYGEAVAQYEQSVADRQSIGQRTGNRNRIEQIKTLSRLGRTHRQVGNIAQSRDRFQAAVELAGLIKNPEAQAQMLIQQGLTEMAANQFDLAIQQFTAAIRLTGPQSRYRLTAQMGMAQSYQRQGNTKAAIEFYQTAIQAGRQRGDVDRASTLIGYGEVLLQSRNVTGAIAALSEGLGVYEALRPGLRDEDKITIVDQQAIAYELLQSAYIQKDDPAAALVTAERGRARAFAELLAQRSRPLLQAPITSVTKTPTGVVRSVSIQVERPVVVPAPTIAEIQATARQEKATIVSYSLINDPITHKQRELYIWVISPQGEIQFRRVDLQPLEAGLSLNKIARSVNTATALNDDFAARSVSNLSVSNIVVKNLTIAMRGKTTSTKNKTSDVITASNNAYKLLIAPIADLLPKSPEERVIFIPQGALFLVPFQALKNDQGQFLIEKHTIQIAPSIQSLMLLRSSARPKPTQSRPLVIGNPTPMPDNLESLPGAENEAKAIGQLLQTPTLIGAAATETAVTAQLSQASLIHFATHGLMDDSQGMNSAIALAPGAGQGAGQDGLLTAGEIFDLRLNADLAVLSACNTGQGRITGDGVIGLSRSLMSAGVPSVMVSLWSVPDRPTQTLMTEFYRLRQSGSRDKAQALRQAMLTTMQQYPDPGDWSGFMLIGSAD
jgi:CHAT domain-containing protein